MKRRFIGNAATMTIPRNIPYIRWCHLLIAVLAVAFVVLFSFFSVSTQRPVAARPAQNAIQIKVDPGYNGYFRADHWTPLLINVSNGGQDVSGDLRVTSSDTTDLSAGAFSTHVDLPNGASKQLFLYINLGFAAQQVKVELATSSGILAQDTQPLKPVAPTDLLFCVITESPRGTVDLQSVHSGVGDSHQVNWRVDNVPDNSEALRALDVMVLTDVDTGNFSESQRQAIGDWVRLGGHLVVTGGPNWQKTQAGVSNLLPFVPNGSTTLTSLPSIASYAGKPGDKLEGPSGSAIVVAQGTSIAGATILAQDSSIPLLARRLLGGGVVDYLAVDPGIEPYQSWKNRNGFWLTLFTTTPQQPTWIDGIVSVGAAQTAANLIKGLRLPDVFQLMEFLAVYIVVIGPLNYLILRRFKRPELAWFTIPLIIVGCSTTAYFTGFSLRGTQATVNRLAVVQVAPDSDRAAVDSVIGVLAPRRASYTVTVHDGMTLRVMADNVGSNANPMNVDAGPTIVQYPDYAARDVPVDAGLTAVFSSSGFTQAPPLDAKATITLQDLVQTGRQSQQPARVSGTVKNTTGLTLENAVVLAMGGSKDIGTLNPGDSASFDLNMAPVTAQAAPLSLGNTLSRRFINTCAYNSNSSGYNTVQDMTVKDIMGRNYVSYYGGFGNYSFGYGDSPEQQELRRREAFLRSVMIDQEPSGGRGDSVYLAGWTTTSPVNVELAGAPYQTEDTTLYLFRIPTTLQATDNEVEVPYSFLTWQATDESSERQIAPYCLTVQAGEQDVFRYNPLPTLRLKDATSMQIVVTGPFLNQGVISLWDWTHGKWVDMKVNSQLTTVSDPQPFLGPENAVQIMIAPADGIRQVAYDRIDIALRGHLADAQK